MGGGGGKAEDSLSIWYSPQYILPPKITSGLSIVGSYVMLREIMISATSHYSRSSSKVIPNLLTGLCLADLTSSIFTFLGPIMVDSSDSTTGSDLSGNSSVWGPKGNRQTCQTQGFFIFLGFVASPLFNSALAGTYLLLVRYNKREQQLRRYQAGVHGSIWLFAFLCAILPIPFGMYNNAGDTCWIAPSPIFCLDHHKTETCDRGGYAAYYYSSVLEGFLPAFGFCFCGIMNYLIWTHVREIETRNSRYATNNNSSNSGRRSSHFGGDGIQHLVWQISTRSRISIGGTTDHHDADTPTTNNNSGRTNHGDDDNNNNNNNNAVATASVSAATGGEPATTTTTSTTTTTTTTTTNATDRTKSEQMKQQALFFTLAFVLTYAPCFISWLVGWETNYINLYDWFEWTAYSIFLPMQGYWNCLVFIRKRKMRTPEGKLFRCLFFSACDNKKCNNKETRNSTIRSSALQQTRTSGNSNVIIPNPKADDDDNNNNNNNNKRNQS